MKSSLERSAIPSNWLNGQFHILKCEPGAGGFSAYRTDTLSDGRSVGGNVYGHIYGYTIDECSEDTKCSSRQGKFTWQYVPMGKIKITDIDKGTYDFKRVPHPATMCHEGCQVSSTGKYIGLAGMRGVDLENTDSNGYHTTFSNIEYTFTGNLCIEGEHNVPGKPPEKLPENDEEKCKDKGGYFGQVNGKDVCLGVDEEKKCLPGQTYGQINGKDVCLTPEGEKLPVPVPGDKNQSGNGNDPDGDGSGGNGKGNGGNGQGNGQGSGGGGGGGSGPSGNGKGDGEGEGEGECAKNPDRLGCMKAGDPQKGQPLGKSDRSVNFERQDVSLPTNGCPAPRNLSVSGMKFRVDLEPLCKAADIARPFVLLLANFSAVFIATLGIKRNKGL